MTLDGLLSFQWLVKPEQFLHIGSLAVARKTGKFNNSFSVAGQAEPISSSMSRHTAVRVYIIAGLANMSAFICRFCSLSHPSVVLNAMIVMFRLLVVMLLVKI
ncbi:unnamed protein product [Cuscuta epithymum]|uniref:Uncharacterized protein n=1 Tax=Cuscuta epithymum TaxID=186058 RepID=A0AAV0FZC2_9ASTE|nr:unnamed protein product [Cuscuta epithymum]CAH9140995.1 unnamed protein product [Cuscuta epithymum]